MTSSPNFCGGERRKRGEGLGADGEGLRFVGTDEGDHAAGHGRGGSLHGPAAQGDEFQAGGEVEGSGDVEGGVLPEGEARGGEDAGLDGSGLRTGTPAGEQAAPAGDPGHVEGGL